MLFNITLNDVFKAINKIFDLIQGINSLTDSRKRHHYSMEELILPVIIMFMLRFPSFHSMLQQPTVYSEQQLNNLLGTDKIPSRDAIEDQLARLDVEELQSLLAILVSSIIEQGVLEQNCIDGYVVAGMDGAEMLASQKKECDRCLTRQLRNGLTEHFHRVVIMALIGGEFHLPLAIEPLHPRTENGEAGDSAAKGEGEHTGAKRCIDRFLTMFGPIVQFLVGDALYLNVPFLRSVIDGGMNAVIRLKGENRLVLRDFKERIAQGKDKIKGFKREGFRVDVWEWKDARLDGLDTPLRVLCFEEHPISQKARIQAAARKKAMAEYKAKKAKKAAGTDTEDIAEEMDDEPLGPIMFVLTTSMDVEPRTIWKMMHERWDIELNTIQNYKKYYNLDHCFSHKAFEQIFLLGVICIVILEYYLCCVLGAAFLESGITRITVAECLRYSLLLHKFRYASKKDSRHFRGT